ncbi:MAG: zinc-dependent metalloprotease family protein [Bacteroidota bacterium]
MKRLFVKLALSIGLLCPVVTNAGNYWQQIDAAKAPKNLQVIHPTSFLVYTMDEAALKLQMWNLSTDPAEGMIVSLPMPDGTYRDFKVWQSPMMEAELAAKYPEIKTFSGEAVNNHAVTAKLEFTLYGFTAMIYDGDNTSLIDPFDNYHDGFYMAHYKRNEVRGINERMKCLVKGEDEDGPAGEAMEMVQTGLPKLAAKTFNGHNLRSYRLALSANNFYCRAATGLTTPTIAQAFSKMTITMNRVNGIYNRDFSVQMNFIANEDTLIWPTATGSINGNDPFNSINSSGGACLGQNQTTVTARVGSANYDLGHVFTTGGGGISSLGVVCASGSKAQSCTGSPSPVGDAFDIDYVAHEMGHEFGSNHTFNNNTDGSCGGNAVSSRAYEPGSGATIMDYAGICSPDDLQAHSDAYFSMSSLIQIQSKLAGSENVCAAITSTGNKLVYLDPFNASYTIPYKTPIELTSPTAIDSVADTAITYGWAQWNRGDFGKRWNQTFISGPIIRSYNPAYVPTRVIPKLSVVLAGNISTMGEKVPDTARSLTFKLVVRSIMAGKGCFVIPDDSVKVTAVSTGAANGHAGFKVISQGTTGISYPGGSTQTVTWNVVGTDVAPVSAANVKISMSVDGGNTWPYTVGTFPNNGSASITVPNPAATSAAVRFKVKGEGNIFFNLNTKNITVTHDGSIPVASGVKNIPTVNDVTIYPVPATDVLHISSAMAEALHASVYNSVGQAVWTGKVHGNVAIPVGAWPRGVYYARFTDAANGNQSVRSFVIQ